MVVITSEKAWKSREYPAVEWFNIEHPLLINLKNVLLSPLHIEQG